VFVSDVAWIVLYLAAGVALVAVGIPLARRRVPRNAWYGFRMPSTMRDDEVWYAVNERSGLHLVVLGALQVVLVLLALLVLGDDLFARGFAIADAAILLAGLAYSIWSCLRLARQIERRRG
jgi:hypothetical protein